MDTFRTSHTSASLAAKAYVHIHKDDWKKLDPKAFEAIFIGYEPDSKGYRLWNKHTCSVVLSRDVTFNESVLPSLKDSEKSPTKSQNPINILPVPVDISTTLPTCARTPTPSDSEEDAVEDLLDQTRIPKIE